MSVAVRTFASIAAAVLAVALPVAADAACGAWSVGPLGLPSQAVMQSTRLGAVPASARTEAPGTIRAQVAGSWLNHWGRDNAQLNRDTGDPGRYQIDMETADAALSLQTGIADGLEIGLVYRNRRRFGGAMDHPIEEFHDLTGFYNAEREYFERDRFHVLLTADDRPERIELTSADAGVFSDSLTVHLQRRLNCGDQGFPAVAIRLSAQTADQRDLENAQPSMGAAVLLEHRVNRWQGFAQMGVYWHGANRFHGLRLRNRQFGALVGLSVDLPRRLELIGQLLYGGSPVAGGFEPVSDPTLESTYGLRWRMRSQRWIEFAMVEGLSRFNNTPDVGWHLAWGGRWDWPGG